MKGRSLAVIKKKYPARRIISFFVCLLISGFLWLITALNHSYTRTIAIPVKFVNFPVGKRVTNPLPQFVLADIRTSGAKLLMMLMKKTLSEVTVDVSKISSVKKGNNTSISTPSVIGNLSRLLNTDVDLIKVRPDSLHFNFGKTSRKLVYVKPQVQINYEIPQGIFKRIKVSPQYVMISADSATLRKIDTLYTEKIVLNQMNQRVEQLTAIEIPEDLEPMISLSAQKVNLQINLDEYAQKTIEVPVEIMNAPPNSTVKTFPAVVKVSLTAPYALFDSLNSSLVKVYADYKSAASQNGKLTLSSASRINDVKVTQISPAKVEYIIRKP